MNPLFKYPGVKNRLAPWIVRAVGFSNVFEDTDKNYRGNIVFISQFDQGFKILGNIYENPGLLEEVR